MSSTRQRLIELLSQSSDKYISGQDLSNRLGISRSAIWKHMNQLKEDGYAIISQPKKGYRIMAAPDKLSENTLSWGLNTVWLGKKIIHHTSLPTTQNLAHQLAQEGATHGTIVVADEQTEGKGRMGKRWRSNEGTISMSMILRPNLLPYLTPQLTLLTATVVAEVLKEMTHVNVQIKWPNDLLIDGKKMTGILTEMQAEQDKVQYIIIGIGINVNQAEESLYRDEKNRGTSILIETGKTWSIVKILQAILEKFEEKYAQYLEEGFHPVKTTWEHFGFRMHDWLDIKSGKRNFQGKFLGIAEDGALIAEKKDKTIEKIYSGEISWFKE